MPTETRSSEKSYRYGTLVEYQNTKRSVKEWGSLTSLSPKLICTRLNRGWPVLKAITTLPKKKPTEYLSYQNNTKTIAEWARSVKKSQRAIKKDLKDGKTIDQALGLAPVREKETKKPSNEIKTARFTYQEDEPEAEEKWWVVYTGKHYVRNNTPLESEKPFTWSWKVIIISQQQLMTGGLGLGAILHSLKLQSSRPDLLIGGGSFGPFSHNEALDKAKEMRPDIYAHE